MSSEDLFVRREKAFELNKNKKTRLFQTNFPQRMDNCRQNIKNKPSPVHPRTKRKLLTAVVPQELIMSSEDLFVRRERAFDLAEKEGFAASSLRSPALPSSLPLLRRRRPAIHWTPVFSPSAFSGFDSLHCFFCKLKRPPICRWTTFSIWRSWSKLILRP